MRYPKRFQNENGDWYWIPSEIEKEYLVDFEKIEGKEYNDCPEAFDSFDEKYSVFATGGDINNVPDYFLSVSKCLSTAPKNPVEENVRDLIVWGEDHQFKLISKASSVEEGWMKSTKAYEIEGLGCIVQVTTQQRDNVAEALTFVPSARIKEKKEKGKVVSRELCYSYK